MIALDTNVLARWILCDDERQRRIAEELVRQPCWLSWTVLLELAWLLASYGKFERERIADLFETFIEMPTFHLDQPDRLGWAIDRYRAGADIADVLHIASTGAVTAFVSFEKSLARKAGTDSPVAVQLAR